MAENSTKILSSTTLSPDRNRNVVNAIYIAGIVFMIGVFLILLWVNLCSQHCWCWHDTPLINRFNNHWILRRSVTRHDQHRTNSKDRHQQRTSNDDELE